MARVGVLVFLLMFAGSAFAQEASLIDVLQAKGVLSQKEAQRLTTFVDPWFAGYGRFRCGPHRAWRFAATCAVRPRFHGFHGSGNADGCCRSPSSHARRLTTEMRTTCGLNPT